MLTIDNIEKILSKAVLIGQLKLNSASAPSYSDSSVSEAFLVGILKDSAKENGFDQNIIIHHGGHAFPDVTINGSDIGIELKGTTSNRKFNGNSVVASTMKKGLKKIYLLYWIGIDKEIGYRDYFESVPNPVVTHSPRFYLDIDLDPAKSMFGLSPNKVGTVEDVIFNGSIDSDKIIKWMAERAKKNNETPWWISTDDDMPTGSTGLVKFTDLPDIKRKIFMKSAFLAFPIILSKSSIKYEGFFEWAITTKSVLSTRDNFSAGGQIEIRLPEFSHSPILVPKIIQVAMESLESNAVVYLEEIENAQLVDFNSVDNFFKTYEQKVKLNIAHIYDDLLHKDTNKIGKNKFSELLAKLIVSKINKLSIRK